MSSKPTEISSKKPVGVFRQIVEVPSKKHRDPRFDSLSGKFNEDLFEKTYSFINEYKEIEIKELQELLRKERDPEEIEKLSRLLDKMREKEKCDQEGEEGFACDTSQSTLNMTIHIRSFVVAMQSRATTENNLRRKNQLKREHKKAELQRVAQGKKPFYLKRSEEKKLELVETYNKLKNNPKKLEKVIEKRRKKNAAKEHKRIPFKRQKTAE
ncbi:2700_t:CDS:2 [Paraglomus occultum]|uniref:rRNA biogenesis protein RRP36 n=1 Tax=Paraglomus occultum TaxID=144539 RepID=A0A9N9A359_9GLOM|nr:2700_t:CDS:2 [Paraglomus occultum]